MLLTKRPDIHLTHTMLAYTEYLAKKRMSAVTIAQLNPKQNVVFAANVMTSANIFRKKSVKVDLNLHMFAMGVNNTVNVH